MASSVLARSASQLASCRLACSSPSSARSRSSPSWSFSASWHACHHRSASSALPPRQPRPWHRAAAATRHQPPLAGLARHRMAPNDPSQAAITPDRREAADQPGPARSEICRRHRWPGAASLRSPLPGQTAPAAARQCLRHHRGTAVGSYRNEDGEVAAPTHPGAITRRERYRIGGRSQAPDYARFGCMATRHQRVHRSPVLA
jgi:hypothetical protein